MASTYVWIRAVHVIFVIRWFAGLFHLPRIHVNPSKVDDAATREHVLLMARKLLRFVACPGAHGWCAVPYWQFAPGGRTRSPVWFCWFNEMPVLLLAAIVVLVVVKPF
jgi:putative membrane protein